MSHRFGFLFFEKCTFGWKSNKPWLVFSKAHRLRFFSWFHLITICRWKISEFLQKCKFANVKMSMSEGTNKKRVFFMPFESRRGKINGKLAKTFRLNLMWNFAILQFDTRRQKRAGKNISICSYRTSNQYSGFRLIGIGFCS